MLDKQFCIGMRSLAFQASIGLKACNPLVVAGSCLYTLLQCVSSCRSLNHQFILFKLTWSFFLTFRIAAFQTTNLSKISTFKPSNHPTFQPSNIQTFQPSNLPPSNLLIFQHSNLPTFQPSNLPPFLTSNLPTF